MRTIKFRFWNKIDRSFVKCDGWNANFCINEMFGDMEKYNLIPLQFTGLLDKNGKEIYEGDIVIGDYTEKDVKKGHIVKYETIYHEMGVAIGFDGISKNIEIIGNIYENSDLLSSQK